MVNQTTFSMKSERKKTSAVKPENVLENLYFYECRQLLCRLKPLIVCHFSRVGWKRRLRSILTGIPWSDTHLKLLSSWNENIFDIKWTTWSKKCTQTLSRAEERALLQKANSTVKMHSLALRSTQWRKTTNAERFLSRSAPFGTICFIHKRKSSWGRLFNSEESRSKNEMK